MRRRNNLESLRAQVEALRDLIDPPRNAFSTLSRRDLQTIHYCLPTYRRFVASLDFTERETLAEQIRRMVEQGPPVATSGPDARPVPMELPPAEPARQRLNVISNHDVPEDQRSVTSSLDDYFRSRR